MKATKQSVARALDEPNPQTRLYLFHGPDEAQSRALGERLVEALRARKSVIASTTLKADPASLVDEAGAMSLFGGRQVIWIEPATKDIEGAVQALLEAPVTESAVVAIAGVLARTSSLLKLAEASPRALACASYAPEGRDAERMVVEVGRRFGLKISSPVAAHLADNCANDQAIVAQELQKLALYVDASPHSPKQLEQEAIEAVGAESAEGSSGRLVDLALGGNISELVDELERIPASGSEAIPVVRSLQRRLLMLVPARARLERGESLDEVMTSLGKSLFWKEKPIVAQMLSNWNAERLARIAERAGALERSLMFSSAPAQEALGEELIAIALQARRRSA